MDNSFDTDAFIRRIGVRLVQEFADAKAGTTASTVGSAAEQPVRDQLEQVLPRGVAVGEGFVIDSYGGTSRQQDVVLYERDLCPVFSVNRTPQTTYYPCEGVIAVGEIKSRLDRDSLTDAFAKIASVKALQRHTVTDRMPHPTSGEPIPLNRDYLSLRRDSVIRLDEGPEDRERQRVFGFVLAGESRMSRETLVGTCRALAGEVDEALAPNVIVTLDGYAVRWGKVAKGKSEEIHKTADGTYGVTVRRDGPERWEESWSAETGTHLGGSEMDDVFRMLVRWIRQGVEMGRTSDIRSFDRYFETKSQGQSKLFAVPKFRVTPENPE